MYNSHCPGKYFKLNKNTMLFFFNIFSIVNTGLKHFIGLGKVLCRYGRNTQISQLQGRGDSKPNILLIVFKKNPSYAYKNWGHDPIWYFSYLCTKISEHRVCFSELYSKQPKSEIHQKMPMFEQLKNQVEILGVFRPFIQRLKL